MTEPTLESRDEAARKARFDDWNDARHLSDVEPRIVESIRAHALTLDKLHGRNEASEAAEFWAQLWEIRDLLTVAKAIRNGNLSDLDRKVIALIEAKFAELRLEWMADMVAPKDKFPNYRYTMRPKMP